MLPSSCRLSSAANRDKGSQKQTPSTKKIESAWRRDIVPCVLIGIDHIRDIAQSCLLLCVLQLLPWRDESILSVRLLSSAKGVPCLCHLDTPSSLLKIKLVRHHNLTTVVSLDSSSSSNPPLLQVALNSE